mgnify:CR=1 FL=1
MVEAARTINTTAERAAVRILVGVDLDSEVTYVIKLNFLLTVTDHIGPSVKLHILLVYCSGEDVMMI